MDATDALLAERGRTHGDYTDHSRVTQAMVRSWEREKNWSQLTDDQRETLHMVAHKIGRILTGSPEVADHWDDIAGYARLSGDRVRMRLTYDKKFGSESAEIDSVIKVRPVPVEDSNRHGLQDQASVLHDVPAGHQWVERLGRILPIQKNDYEWRLLPDDERGCYQWSSGQQSWLLTAND